MVALPLVLHTWYDHLTWGNLGTDQKENIAIVKATPTAFRVDEGLYLLFPLLGPSFMSFSLCEYLLLLNGFSSASSYFFMSPKCELVSVFHLMYRWRKIYLRDLGEETLTYAVLALLTAIESYISHECCLHHYSLCRLQFWLSHALRSKKWHQVLKYSSWGKI